MYVHTDTQAHIGIPEVTNMYRMYYCNNSYVHALLGPCHQAVDEGVRHLTLW